MADGVKIDRNTEVDAQELASVLGLTVRRVKEIPSEEHPVFERCSRGRYKLCECVQAYINFKAKNRPAAEAVADAERIKAVAEADYKKAKAEMAQLEASELKGKMHRADDVQILTNDLIYAVRGGLMALPGRLSLDLAPAMSPAEVSEIVKREVYALLRELASYKYDPVKYEERVLERMKWDGEDEEDE